ncbi:helix-turn-helix domain-containing protein [Kitasatospora sp. NPDC096204]|uniref:helix-turn-helix domain-containing protein n=1 Tax=Kitasatospora sp. NPDC096204 TaxID=3364094 RepID=UPI00381507D4
MTQAELGRACGYSASAISRVEAGLLRPADQPLAVIVRVLGIRLDDISKGRPANLARNVTLDQEDAMLRRQLLVAGMAAAGTSVLPSSVARASRPDTSARIVGALYEPTESAPVSLQQLGRALTSARAQFTAARTRISVPPSLVCWVQARRLGTLCPAEPGTRRTRAWPAPGCWQRSLR